MSAIEKLEDGKGGKEKDTIRVLSVGERASDKKSEDRIGNVRGRKKVPLKPGFSALDWARTCASGTDLTGTGGKRFQIPMSEVRKHNTLEDAWTVIRGKVFCISPYLNFHPGGVPMIMKAAGRDGTALFEKYHRWVNPEALLQPCIIGVLTPEP